MTKDKRLDGFLELARQKRQDGSGMHVKEWCVLADYGYDQGLAITRMEGFPIFNGRIVWEDWVKWRQIKLQLAAGPRSQTASAPRSALASKSGE